VTSATMSNRTNRQTQGKASLTVEGEGASRGRRKYQSIEVAVIGRSLKVSEGKRKGQEFPAAGGKKEGNLRKKKDRTGRKKVEVPLRGGEEKSSTMTARGLRWSL